MFYLISPKASPYESGMLCDTATDNNANVAFLAPGDGAPGRQNKLLTRHNLILSHTRFTWPHY